MSLLTDLLAGTAAVVRSEAKQVRRAARGLLISAALVGMTALFASVGLGLCLVAMFLALRASYDSVIAALVTGLVALGFAGGLGIITALRVNR